MQFLRSLLASFSEDLWKNRLSDNHKHHCVSLLLLGLCSLLWLWSCSVPQLCLPDTGAPWVSSSMPSEASAAGLTSRPLGDLGQVSSPSLQSVLWSRQSGPARVIWRSLNLAWWALPTGQPASQAHLLIQQVGLGSLEVHAGGGGCVQGWGGSCQRKGCRRGAGKSGGCPAQPCGSETAPAHSFLTVRLSPLCRVCVIRA